jgi:hypothetical protein
MLSFTPDPHGLPQQSSPGNANAYAPDTPSSSAHAQHTQFQPDSAPIETFLELYPHPAWILAATPRPGKAAPPLAPRFANSALRRLLLGVSQVDSGAQPRNGREGKEDDREGEGLGILESMFLDGLGGMKGAQTLGHWLTNDEPVLELELTPRWMRDHELAKPVTAKLAVTKTRLVDAWVCTSVPQAPLPRPPSPQSSVGRGPPPQVQGPMLKRKNTPPRMTDMPSHTSPGASQRGEVGTEPKRNAMQDLFFRAPDGAGSVRHLLQSFDWSKTKLGPRESWPLGTETALSYMLNHPFPVSRHFLFSAAWLARKP